MNFEMVMQELEALGKERTKKYTSPMVPMNRSYRCDEADSEENKNQSTVS